MCSVPGMRIAISAVFLLLVAACGGGTSDTTVTTSPAPSTTTTAAASATTVASTTTEAPGTTEAPAAGRLELYSVTFGAFMVVIHNGTPGTIDMTGYHLCQEGQCAEIPSIGMPPDSYLSLNTGSQVFLPIPGSLTVDDIVDIGGFDPEDGEIALFASDDYVDLESLLSYVEWGLSGHVTSSMAVAAGLWEDGWFVPTFADTAAITYQPDTSTAHESGWNTY